MSESKCSQNDELDDKSLMNVISFVLRNKKINGLWSKPYDHDRQLWLMRSAFQFPKYINKYLSMPSVIWFLRTDNRIQSKTL